MQCFNTQPPEGGWRQIGDDLAVNFGFQHTAARRRLAHICTRCDVWKQVSTHSRPKAAGVRNAASLDNGRFQHTAARRRLANDCGLGQTPSVCFNTQPPEGGWIKKHLAFINRPKFQHTAARRRLAIIISRRNLTIIVSTHSRPKAAG